MLIEYFGVNGDSLYDAQAAHKMRVFRDAGMDGIYLTESTMKGRWQELIVERIEQVLEGKLTRIQRHRIDMTAKASA